MAKTAKKSKKIAKKGWFITAKFSPWKWLFLFVFPPICLACPIGTFWPRNFDFGLCLHGDMTKTKLPFSRIFIENTKFFTDQNMIEAIVQNYDKTKGPQEKVNKTRFEVHGRRMVKHQSTLIWVLRKQP